MGKIDTLNGYIEECDKVIKSNNTNLAYELIYRIIAVYGIEIKRLGARLPYSGTGNSSNIMDDIPTLKQILGNHKDDLELAENREIRELEKLKLQSSTSITNNNNLASTSSANATVTVSITNAIERLQALPDTTISQEEKEILEEKLAALQVALSNPDKEKTKSKLTNVLKYVGDKCIDAGIAVLPYLGQVATTI